MRNWSKFQDWLSDLIKFHILNEATFSLGSEARPDKAPDILDEDMEPLILLKFYLNLSWVLPELKQREVSTQRNQWIKNTQIANE